MKNADQILSPCRPTICHRGSPLLGFRWTDAGGFERIGPVPGQTAMQASAVSGDGKVVFGYVQRGPLDRIETEASEFHKRVRESYLKLAAAHPERIRMVDGRGSITEVSQRVWDVVSRALEAHA